MHIRMHMSFQISVFIFFRYMHRSGLLDHMLALQEELPQEPPYCFPQWLHQFICPLTVQEGSLFSTLSPAFIPCRFFDGTHSAWYNMIAPCGFDLHFSLNNTEHLFMCLLAACISSLEKLDTSLQEEVDFCIKECLGPNLASTHQMLITFLPEL